VRAFVAVALAPPESEAPARRAPEHLTLRFLGEISPESVPALEATLRPALAPLAPFDLVVEGIGAFPSAERPRVVWRGVGSGEAPLRRLAGAVRDAVRAAGFPDDPVAFTPHVTLFRVRSPRDQDRARALLDRRTPPPPPTRVVVREVELLESTLTGTGAIHQVRARFPLAGGAV
jgi:RNA 2',3'-cyclic 3'-phosphodiesterase